MRSPLSKKLILVRQIGLAGALYRIYSEVSARTGVHQVRFSPQPTRESDFFREWRAGTTQGRGAERKIALLDYMRERTEPEFFFDHRQREKYARLLNLRFPSVRARLISEADTICSHRFDLLGSGLIDLGPNIDWHSTLSTASNAEERKGRWPLEHWSRIDIRSHRRIADVKLNWELNRHQHLITLGRAYWFSGEECYAVEFRNQLESWIADNPREMGVNWLSNLELAVRSISWIWAYHYFLSSPSLTPETNYEFLRSMLEHALHLEKDLPYTRYCIPNNHLVGDAAGLAMIGVVFPEFARSSTWRRLGLGILTRELIRQTYPDGSSRELSVSYLRFVMYFYLMAAKLAELNGRTTDPALWQRLEACFKFIASVITPDGEMPMLGDSDDGRAVILSCDPPGEYRTCLSTAAVLFERGDFKDQAGELSEETFWLLGEEAIDRYGRLGQKSQERQSVAFHDGGYYVLRSQGEAGTSSQLLFRSGPACLDRIRAPGHAHSEALSFVLCSNGRLILTDPGTYAYNAELKWKDFFRNSLAHNTNVVDGQPQAEPYGTWRWADYPLSRLTAWVTSATFDLVEGEHDGYSRLPQPIVHRRSILSVKGEYWVVVDRLEGDGYHTMASLLHFAPVPVAVRDHQMTYMAGDANSGLIIRPASTGRIVAKTIRGQEEPIQGWVSPSYGVRLPAPVLSYEVEALKSNWLALFLIPVPPGLEEFETRAWQGTNYFGLGIHRKDVEDVFILSGHHDGAIGEGNSWTTDAKVCFRRMVGGEMERLILVDGSYWSGAGFVITVDRKARLLEGSRQKDSFHFTTEEKSGVKCRRIQ